MQTVLTSAGTAALGRAKLLCQIGLLGLCLMSICGVANFLAFDQPSLLKYGVTVGAPLLLLALITLEKPVAPMFSLLVVGAPFGSYAFSVGPVQLDFITVLVVLAVTTVVFRGPRLARHHGVAPGVIVFLIVVAFGSAALSKDVVHYFTWLLAGIATAWVAAEAVREQGRLEPVLFGIAAAAALQAALALWEFQSGHALNLYASTAVGETYGASGFYNFGEIYRSSGAFSDPISLGNFLAIGAVTAFVMTLKARTSASTIFMTALFCLIALGLIVTFSRQSWIGAILGVATVLLLRPTPSVRRGLVVLCGAGVAAVVLGTAIAGPDLTTRLTSIASPTSSANKTAQGDEDRLAYWHAAGEVALDHPVLGVGLGRLLPYLTTLAPDVETGTHAHSTYLQVAAETGIPGFLALMLVLVLAWRGAAGGLIVDRTYAVCCGALVVLMVCWMTDYTIRYVPVMVSIAPMVGIAVGARSRAIAAGVAR